MTCTAGAAFPASVTTDWYRESSCGAEPGCLMSLIFLAASISLDMSSRGGRSASSHESSLSS
eukprot:CAMPEP_0172085076 /NCGR_PEP_ID=MMETSP1043-20130122/21346_1 /TAXON_ID=464988 /ORGANISM="Hemiselmis andersenii, Strain CCMP441" /LENGTH=61 /DNA_ID=CAMNT_0012746967 /DNA_START=115 /DNA_END=300 /DNA_ORIENTATION=-